MLGSTPPTKRAAANTRALVAASGWGLRVRGSSHWCRPKLTSCQAITASALATYCGGGSSRGADTLQSGAAASTSQCGAISVMPALGFMIWGSGFRVS